MTVDRKRLRELALAATPGWYYAGCWTVHNGEHHEVAHPANEADAHFIAAANPQTILELLDALDAAEQPAPDDAPYSGLLSRYDDESSLSARETLAVLMSEISEEFYCAGWVSGNEFRLWRAVTDPADDLQYGLGEIPREQVERLRMLSAMCGGWVAWEKERGAVFVPRAEWEQRYAAIQAQERTP